MNDQGRIIVFNSLIIINRCYSYLIPVLSVHDSFIVEETNSNFIIDTMNNAIKDTGLTSIPLIK